MSVLKGKKKKVLEGLHNLFRFYFIGRTACRKGNLEDEKICSQVTITAAKATPAACFMASVGALMS